MRIRPILFALFLAATLACSGQGDSGHGFSVAAPEAYVGASVFLDGQKIGELAHLEMRGSWLQSVMKRIHGDSAAFQLVVFHVDLSKRSLPGGEHQLRVEKPGQPSALGSFRYPLSEPFQIFYVNGSKIQAGVPMAANSP